MDRTHVRPEAGTRRIDRIPLTLLTTAIVVSLYGAMPSANAGTLALADTSAAAGGGGSSGSELVVLGSTRGEKSGRTAFLSSLLATTALGGAAWATKSSTGGPNHSSALGTTTALGIAAYLAGPSVGHFYAGRSRRAWFGIGARGLIGLGFGATLVTLIDEGSANDQDALGIAFMAAGAVAAVADIVDAPRSARIHNERVRRVSIGPASIGGAPGVRVDVGL